ncbi:RHS repeat-associated core domain-containing protein [Pseudomonas syringae]|uniref:RHS repeat-associated core domain-containing protein n=1 Tax=Pseudomonas syringae TaxID=317 RepID=UPI00089B804B|nr:RHS repeat-associated core domain-containing protein [Pseudomonas syringae]SDW12320.1 RHS repeat-associated core domain-containing protein [Pseudomonas syringae]SFL43700.1 RHS repeat-associated core domain-containing protein [Pseudomonas syringae]
MDDTTEARRVLCRYRYDALDRVAVINIEAQEAVSRFYQKSRLTVEIQGAVRRRIVHGDDRLLAEHEADGAVARVNLLGTDMQGSVLEAVSGQERQSLAYNPYGHRAQGGPFSGFNGERVDPVTGHYLLGNGYRAFNPVLMRFNSPDSLSPFGRGGLNAYAYCQGDPVNRSDSGGHAPVPSVHRPTMSPGNYFQKLPNEMIAKIIPYLSLDDVVALATAYPGVGEKVLSLSKNPLIDVNNQGALQTIDKVLQGNTSLSPDLLKNDGFRAQFERLAENLQQTVHNDIQRISDQAQSIYDEMAGVRVVRGHPSINDSNFQRNVARNRQENARFIGVLKNIDKLEAEYTKLNTKIRSRKNLKEYREWYVGEIRKSLNSP